MPDSTPVERGSAQAGGSIGEKVGKEEKGVWLARVGGAGAVSRKVSIRIPEPLWEWLCLRAGNQPVTAVVLDCLNTTARSIPGGKGENRFWLWGAVLLVVGLFVAFRVVSLKNEREQRRF